MIKRFPNESDFSFLNPLWGLVKNPRNGLLCGDHIPRLMAKNGFTQDEYGYFCHPAFYGAWSVTFWPETETLWVSQAYQAPWKEALELAINGPIEVSYV